MFGHERPRADPKRIAALEAELLDIRPPTPRTTTHAILKEVYTGRVSLDQTSGTPLTQDQLMVLSGR